MTPILLWTDVCPFSGRIVAYTSSSWWFTKGCWHPSEVDGVDGAAAAAPLTCYGWVESSPCRWGPSQSRWDTGEFGHSLAPLWVPGAFHHNCALIGSELNHADLRMRLADDGEIQAIRRAVAVGDAEFNYTTGMPRGYELVPGRPMS